MSTIKHLWRAVQILRDAYEDEIQETLEREGQWTWNLKNWTIQFVEEYNHKSITAYRAKDELTNWSDYITLEAFTRKWEQIA